MFVFFHPDYSGFPTTVCNRRSGHVTDISGVISSQQDTPVGLGGQWTPRPSDFFGECADLV